MATIWDTSIMRWNDGTCPRMLQAILERKAWGNFPILADALEEAGFTGCGLGFLRNGGAQEMFRFARSSTGKRMEEFLAPYFGENWLPQERPEFSNLPVVSMGHFPIHLGTNYASLPLSFTYHNVVAENRLDLLERFQELSGLPVIALSITSNGIIEDYHPERMTDRSELLRQLADVVPMLEKLQIRSRPPIEGDAELATIARLTELRELELDSACRNITRDGIEALGKLRHLGRLEWSNTLDLNRSINQTTIEEVFAAGGFAGDFRCYGCGRGGFTQGPSAESQAQRRRLDLENGVDSGVGRGRRY